MSTQNTKKIEKHTLDSLIKKYISVSSLRPDLLFTHFLPMGYRHTTLNSVDNSLLTLVIFAKVHLGMIITLYDDLADHPKYRNPKLLEELYTLNIGKDKPTPLHLSGQDRDIFELARFLFQQMNSILERFSHYGVLRSVLFFDIEQFYICNRHSDLMSSLPEVRNMSESQILGPYNMGIVAAGTIDLMASPFFQLKELGPSREVFITGQRLGRISNLLFTFKREKYEGDCTNEILIAQDISQDEGYRTTLLQEFSDKLRAIRNVQIQTFDTTKYSEGIMSLHYLHSSLEGKI
jgi:hypothetical protein